MLGDGSIILSTETEGTVVEIIRLRTETVMSIEGGLHSKIPRRPRVSPSGRKPTTSTNTTPGSTTAIRQVGKYLETVEDVMANPQLLEGQTYAQVRGILNGSKGWVHDEMHNTRG